MSTRIARRERRNHEHGHEWVDPERAQHEAVVRANRFIYAARTGAMWRSLRTLAQHTEDALRIAADLAAGRIKPPLESHARETWWTDNAASVQRFEAGGAA